MSLSSRTSRVSFPLWAKLALAFLLIFIVPLAIGVGLFVNTTQTINRENLGAFVQQNGQRQRQVINNLFVRASERLDGFASDSETNQLLVGLLLADRQISPPIPTSSEVEIEAALATTLLDPAETLFRDVIVLNADGIVVVSSGDLLPGEAEPGQDYSESDAYQQMIVERNTDPTLEQIIVVENSATRPIQLVNRVTLRNTENVIGYVVAALNVETTLDAILSFDNTVYPAYSFLLSRNGTIITPASDRVRAEAARNSDAVNRAFDLQTGFDFVRQENGAGDEVASYYAPVVNEFALLTQVSTAEILELRRSYFETLLFPVFVGVIVLATVLALLSRHLTEPLEGLQRAMQAFSVGVFDSPVPSAERGDEIGDVARSFVDMRQQTRNLIEDLERRIERRTRDMETTQEITNYATKQRDVQALMEDVVDLIVDRFNNIYHAQIFMVDNDERFAVLRASTGTPGRELLSRGHRLALGVGVVGQAAAQKAVVVARDTADSDVHRPNEFLQDTRAELALPLYLGDQVIGVLDVQSRESASFDRQQINVLQSMAAQLAIAIENTRLYQESIQRLHSLQVQSRDETKRAWQEYMYDNRTQRITQQAGMPTTTDFDQLRQRAIDTNAPTVGDLTERDTIPVAIPLRMGGDVIGAIAYELPNKIYTPDNIRLAEELAERLSLSLDNKRLVEQSRRATERERLVNEISAKLTTQTDVNLILQTAVREVGQALRAPQVSIRLNRAIYSPDPTDDDTPATDDS